MLREKYNTDYNKCWEKTIAHFPAELEGLHDFRCTTSPNFFLPKLTQKQACDCSWSQLIGHKMLRQYWGVDFHFQVGDGAQLQQPFINN